MNKVTLKTFYNRYTRGTPGPVPFEKSFSISTTTTTQFEQLSNLSVSNFNLEKGDEIIVPFKTYIIPIYCSSSIGCICPYIVGCVREKARDC
jgi:hypothetical protein